ncbi:MAG: Glu/Leu/Phe/Val dehydrogenase dimerization domain-containing protein [Halieaceae bacterium]|jgi:leucine dehydrogenase|nr:Glu/Leu/Phe/Val dehydrogenase dimerization domain-containing protein [Halieaceae bacterium]
MSVFDAPAFDQHEEVSFARDADSGLRAIIAVHDRSLGPAVGGCRVFPYSNDAQALDDVLRLSRGMTYKSALAGLPLGGGKSVIIADPRCDKTPALLAAMGRFIDRFGGRYVAAEDSGTSVEDLRQMARETRHVSGIDGTEHGGDPSPSTARGVFIAIRTALRHRLGSDALGSVRVAVQGLGHVGYRLAALLRAEGAEVVAADVDLRRCQRAEAELGVRPLSIDDIVAADVDVFAPCALGDSLNAASIPRLRAGIVAGAANNQLHEEADAARLADRGILYCPDFLINAGGIIDVHFQRSGWSRSGLERSIAAIGERLEEVLRRADESRRPTSAIAEDLAREMLESARRAGETAPRCVA